MGIIPQKKRNGKRKLCNISVHFGETGRTVTLPWETETWSVSPGTQGTPQHQVCGGVLHQGGDRAAQRAGAVLPVPAAAGQQFHRTLLRRQRDAQLRQASPRLVQQLPGDGDQGSVVEWVEDKGGVQTVEELRGKGLPCVGQHLPLQGGPVPLRAGGEAQAGSPHEALGTQVGGHDQHGVAEIRFAAPAVGKHPLLHHLEQDGPDIPMGLLQLVQQHHGPGGAAHRLGELSAVLMAHIARGGADEAGDGVGFHILRHVEANQGVLTAEEDSGQGPAQLGLAHAAGTQEEEAAGGPAAVF